MKWSKMFHLFLVRFKGREGFSGHDVERAEWEAKKRRKFRVVAKVEVLSA